MASEASRNELVEVAGQIRERHEELYQAVCDLLSHLPPWIPDFAVDQFVGKWDTVNADLSAAATDFEKSIQATGTPWTLRTAADEWTNGVSKPLAALESTVEDGALADGDVFSGEAAEKYRTKLLPGQVEAIESVRDTYMAALSSFLDAVAEADENFQDATMVMGVALVAAIITALASMATAHTLVGPILGLVALILEAALFIATAIERDRNIDSALETAMGTVQQLLLPVDPFGRGGETWPQAVFR